MTEAQVVKRAGQGEALGNLAKRVRSEAGTSAAKELGIETDDDLSDTEFEMPQEEGAGGDGEGDVKEEAGTTTVSQEELVRRRLGRMKELQTLYKEQYWRLLEELRKKHWRFYVCNGHSGRKEDAAALAQEREKEGLPAACCVEECKMRPVPLSHYCLAHIIQDPRQVLYMDGGEDGPVLCTEDLPLPTNPNSLAGTRSGTGEGDANVGADLEEDAGVDDVALIPGGVGNPFDSGGLNNEDADFASALGLLPPGENPS